MSADVLIDTFVQRVNQSPRRRIREEDVPLLLREGTAHFGLYYSWTIRRDERIHWIEALEKTLKRPLPSSYRSLVTRYIFPAFDLERLTLLANTGRALYYEMSDILLHDRVLSKTLLKNGYAQFARLASGETDPVCFDFNRLAPNGETPVVRIRHSSIVAHDRIEVMEDLAPSFSHLIEAYLQQAPTQVPA